MPRCLLYVPFLCLPLLSAATAASTEGEALPDHLAQEALPDVLVNGSGPSVETGGFVRGLKVPSYYKVRRPAECWSTEEAFRTAELLQDAEAAFQLVLFWSRNGMAHSDLYPVDSPSPAKLALWSDMFKERAAGAPWFHEPSHWYDYWLHRAASGTGDLSLVLRRSLAGRTALNDPVLAGWLMNGAASGDPVFCRFLMAEMGRADKGSDVFRKLQDARCRALAALHRMAVNGEPGAAAEYGRMLRLFFSESSVPVLPWEESLMLEMNVLLKDAAARGDALALDASGACEAAVKAGYIPPVRPADCMADGAASGTPAAIMLERGDLPVLLRTAKHCLQLAGEASGKDDARAAGKRAEAERLLQRASMQNSGAAMLLLCDLYEGRYGGDKSPDKAGKLAMHMAALNYAPGLLRLAKYKEEGYGSHTKNPEKAYELVYRAASSLYPEALVEWGRYLMLGIGCEPDGKRALKVLLRVYEDAPKVPRLAFFLGYLYEDVADSRTACRYYQEGVQSGDDRAMNNLASMYERGSGVTRDKEKARSLYKRSADLGNGDALSNLARLEKSL